MWNDLSFKDRSDIISLCRKYGMENLSDIRKFYNDNVANKFAEGGDTAPVDYEVRLPEVTVTPTKESRQLGREMRRTIKDPVLRKQFYNYILKSDRDMETPFLSDNDKMGRFLELYKESGSPSIRLRSPHARPYALPEIPMYGGLNIPTSYYSNEGDNESNIVAEMSHAYLFNNELSDTLGLKPSFGRWALQEIGRTFDDSGMYDRLGNYEFDAHSLIEPVMHEYIRGVTDDFEGTLRDVVHDAWNSPNLYSGGIDKHAAIPGFVKKAQGGFIGLDPI